MPDTSQDSLQQRLSDRFGFQQFLPGQRQVVKAILAGESAAAIFPTGAGKSLCYQLPALELTGLTLVVSPLLSLMKDQIDFMTGIGLAAVKLDSAMGREDFQKALAAARNGAAKILMISVERFKNERFRLQLAKMKVSMLVVDEAHCISEWGHNFRPDYLKIPAYRRQYRIPQVLLLTATAAPKVVDDMCRKFEIPRENVVCTGFYRQNLHLQVLPAPPADKDRMLADLLAAPPTGPSIVYTIQQKTAETVAEKLSNGGVNAAAYHAGMSSERREDVQNRFMKGRIDVVAATIAFGMGIDKADIRKVIHYDLPKSIENYSQEIGRAGRDGKPSTCTVLGDRGCLPVLENFVYGDTPEKEGLRQVLNIVKTAGGKRLEVRFTELSSLTDIRLLPLKTVFAYLELKGILRPKYVFFEDYPFKFIRSAVEITAAFKGEREAFVEAVFAHANTARVWTRLDIDAVAAATGSDRRRVVAALDYFDEKGWIELRPKSSVEVFTVTDPDFDVAASSDWLHELFLSKEAQEIERIRRMLSLLEESSCLAVGLSEYFGETLAGPCGLCSACRRTEPLRLPREEMSPLGTHIFSELAGPLLDKLDSPVSAALVARFLCGIRTPALSRIRAGALKGFGRLASYPYRDVLAWAARQIAPAGSST